jgi:hypothetical protein
MFARSVVHRFVCHGSAAFRAVRLYLTEIGFKSLFEATSQELRRHSLKNKKKVSR